jgi:hypothetical protein
MAGEFSCSLLMSPSLSRVNADALSFSSSALFYRGYRIPLSRGWRSCVMSIEASDEMLYASTAFVVHFRPAATTTGVDLPDLRGTRASLRLAWGGAGAVSAIANDTDSEGENNNGDVFADRSHPLYQLMGAPLPGKGEWRLAVFACSFHVPFCSGPYTTHPCVLALHCRR